MPAGKYSDPELQSRYDEAVAGIQGANSQVPGYDQYHTGYQDTLAQFQQDALKQLTYSFDAIENPNTPAATRRNAVTSIEKLSTIGSQDILQDPLFAEYAKSVGSLGTDRIVKSPTKKGDSFFQDRGFVAPSPGDSERELVQADWAQPKSTGGPTTASVASQLPNTFYGTAALLGSAQKPQYQSYQPTQLQQVQQRPWQSPALDPSQMISDRSINSMQTVYGNDPFAFQARIDPTGVNAQKNSISYIDQLLATPYQQSAFGSNPYAFSKGVDQTGKNMQVSAGNYFGSVLSSPAMRSAMANQQSAFRGLNSNWTGVTSAFGGDPFVLSSQTDPEGLIAQREGLDYFRGVMGDKTDSEGVTYLRNLIENQGQDAASKAHYEKALNESERVRAANAQASLAEMDRQGRGGGGLSLMAQLEGADASMATQYNAALEAAAMEQARRDAANAQMFEMQFAEGQRRDQAGAALMAGGNALRAQQFGEAALSAQQIDALRAARAAGMDAVAIAKATGLDQFTVQKATAMDQMAMYDQQRRLAAASGQAQVGATLYGQELNAAIAAAGGIDAMYQSEAARRDAANVNRAQIGYNLRNQQASELFHIAGQIDQMTAARANLMAQIDEINSGRVYASSETYNQYARALDQVNAQIYNQQALYDAGVRNQETFSQNRYMESSQQQGLSMLASAMQQDAGRTVAVLSQQMGLDANQQANFIGALNSSASRAQQQQIIDAQLKQQGISAADIAGVLAPIAGAALGGIAGGPVGAAIGGTLAGGIAAGFGGSPTGMSAVPTISQAFMPAPTPYQAPAYSTMPQQQQQQPFRAGVLSADQF